MLQTIAEETKAIIMCMCDPLLAVLVDGYNSGNYYRTFYVTGCFTKETAHRLCCGEMERTPVDVDRAA
ncbi:MAG TPA: hypothetical protein VNN62_01725 [Methylomirabilota bacterium]|nr:hypothetical protein [Methylomirabilota bacterium]